MTSCLTLLLAAAGSLALSFEKPLASGHLNFCDNLRRFDVALEKPMDLSSATGVSFELKLTDPSIIENVWLLFKSGAGYYRAAAAKPPRSGVWTPTTVAKADVRLYHWDAHVSLWEKMAHPAAQDLPDWSRVEGFQVVVAIGIDRTSADASVSARGFAPTFTALTPRPPVLPGTRIGRLPNERRLICTHVWGVDHDWEKTCRDLVKYGITDVSPLLAHGGYAYYKTRFGVEHPLVAKYGDALKQSVEACRRHGMKCHPRRSCWSLGFQTPAATLAEFRKASRLQMGFDGQEGAWLCPTHPDNLRREIDGLLELAEAGADGIMIDFFRYPNPDFCFCERCRARFEKTLGRRVEPWPQAVRTDSALAHAWSRFRCDVMSEAFAVVSRQVKAAAPKLELSAAVSATVKGAEDRGQDWPRWCRDGGLDVLYPMCYYSTEKMLKRDLVGLKAAVAGTRTKLVPIIAFASGDIPFVEPTEFARQVETVRAEGIRDLAFFRLQEYAPVCLDAVFGRNAPAKPVVMKVSVSPGTATPAGDGTWVCKVPADDGLVWVDFTNLPDAAEATGWSFDYYAPDFSVLNSGFAFLADSVGGCTRWKDAAPTEEGVWNRITVRRDDDKAGAFAAGGESAGTCPPGVEHRRAAAAAIDEAATFERGVADGLKDADPMIRRYALAALAAKDEARAKEAAKGFLADSSPAVRKVAKALCRAGGLYRENVARSIDPLYDHASTVIRRLPVKGGKFVLRKPLPETAWIEIDIRNPSEDLYVWLNGIYLGQFDFDSAVGRVFRLDGTKETKAPGENVLEVKRANGETVRVRATVEVLK